jgi:hypothetical protein
MCISILNSSTGLWWPTTNSSKVLSSPRCLNEAKEFVHRECSKGQWGPEPNCSFTQPKTLSQCPENFVDASDICYQFTTRSTFPPRCPFENVLPFDSYKDKIPIVGPIWVPARRDLLEGLGFMRWTQHDLNYKSEVQNYTITKPITEKNCLIYHRKSYVAVSCVDEYVGVCAYNKLNHGSNQLCGGFCLQSDFTRGSKCFCLLPNIRTKMSWSNQSKAEFAKPYQYTIYHKLTREPCAIGLEKTPNGSYIWSNSNREIDYTFWAPDAVFDETHIYGAATPRGWILTEKPVACMVIEKDVQELTPTLNLKFDADNFRFLVTVGVTQSLKSTDSGILLFCFTDADSLSLVYRFQVSKIIRDYGDAIMYEFEPVGRQPGHYWCEAFRHVDSSVVRSQEYFLGQGDQLEFVAVFQVLYDGHQMNPLSQDVIHFLQTNLFVVLNNDFYVSNYYVLRVMKIVDLDEEKGQVMVNVHFSQIAQNFSVDPDGECAFMKEHVGRIIAGGAVKLVDFHATDFCASETNELSWPKTSLGSVAFPEQYCFRADGSRVMRLCDGDFIDGARWSQFDDCEVFKGSSVTQRLELTLLSIPRNQSAEWINRILRNYTYFQPLDVYFVATAYSHYLTPPNVSVFTETFENFLKINKSVLAESQLKLRTTDKFLYFIDNILINSDEIVEVVEDDFALFLSESKNLSGIAVLRIEDKFEVVKLRGNKTVDDIMAIENLDSAIWLNPELSQYWYDEEKLTISLFFNDALFQQARSVRTDSVIFGVSGVGYLDDPIRLLQRSRTPDGDCAYWSYDTDSVKGTWRRNGQVLLYPPFVMCEFWFAAHFALISSHHNDDVTDNLIDLLASNDSVPEAMHKLSDISDKFDEFKAIDVSFVGQILRKVSDDDEVDLARLAQIVSNLHEIKRDVLSNSQNKNGATDMVLHYVDAIIQNHDCDSDKIHVIADNFMILIVDLEEIDFSGLALLDHNGTTQVQILGDNVTIDDVKGCECFDSAVVFSSELKEQLKGSKVIVTAFASDALFNEQVPKSKLVRRIFGVILPKIGEFDGPVSVLEKANGDERQCVHWLYNNFDSRPGAWHEDDASKEQSGMIQCDFWHTTHFSMLIIDDDKYSGESDKAIKSLDLITTINCVISMLSLGGIIITAVLFRDWRANTGNQILLNFTFAIILHIVVFYISNVIDKTSEDYLLCTIIGVLLHYALISQFCWMLVIAILQFRRFVIVLDGRPKSILLKGCICGWGLPLVPTVSVFSFDRKNYVNSRVGLCYPSGWGLYLGVWLPVGLIILINLVIFAITLYNVSRKKVNCFGVGNRDAVYQWRLAILLFFMLGLTWGFGFLSELDFGLVFVYLFCFTATLQGFIIFLFFIVLNPSTRYLYSRAIRRYYSKVCK